MAWTARACMALALVAPTAAVDRGLDQAALQDAVSLGQSRITGARDRFHAAYRVSVGTAPVDYLEIVTPFRAVVLAAEGRARAGDRQFGLREARATYAMTADETVVRVELTFHPHNTFVGVPLYDVVLEADTQSVRPVSIDRVPRFGPRVEGDAAPPAQTSGVLRTPGGSQPLMGGALVCRLPAGTTDPRGRYQLVLRDGQRLLVRVPLDLSRYR